MSKDAALSTIKAAKLPATLYRTARELLDRAHPENGFALVPLSELGEITGVETLGAQRRHLTQLQAAQVIHYHINGDVHVSFHAWARQNCAPVIENGSPTRNSGAEPRAESDHPRAESDHPRAESDHPRAESDHLSHAQLVGGLYTDRSLEETSQPTNQTRAREPGPEPTDAQRSMALLTDPSVAVAHSKAKELAQKHSFDWVRRYVAAWWPSFRRGEAKVGLLVHRMDQGFEPPELGRDFRESDLYRRHRIPEDAEAEQLYSAMLSASEPSSRREIRGPERIEPPAADADLREKFAFEMRHSALPEILKGPLLHATCEEAESVGGVQIYRIALPPDAHVRTIEDRAGPFVRRTLSRLTGRSSLAEFVVAEAVP